jgi:hypothetical protein
MSIMPGHSAASRERTFSGHACKIVRDAARKRPIGASKDTLLCWESSSCLKQAMSPLYGTEMASNRKWQPPAFATCHDRPRRPLPSDHRK